MKRWIISDTHFHHTNIIKYCDRPYKDVNDMNKSLVKNWNNVVGKSDIVYHLGDFSMSCNINCLRDLVSKLNGKIVLVMGNHDTRTPKQYLDCGFYQATRKPIMIDEKVILMHEPPTYVAEGIVYLFGHVHNKTTDCEKFSNCKCVCCERTNYKPIDLDELLTTIK